MTVPKPGHRDAESLAAPFRKDPCEESFLEELNELLADRHDEEVRAMGEVGNARGVSLEEWPILHVIGPPRSGTTLLMQLVTSHLDVGYINNLAASFWRAPLFGIRLSRKLCPESAETRFVSRFGRTTSISEPHEFGYFWKDLLNYPDLSEQEPGHEETVDWERAGQLLTAMAAEFHKPLVFKSFLVGWHAARVCREMSRTCVVQIRRDPTDTARSLYGMRKHFGGSIDTWTSLKPREYSWLKDEPTWDQLVGQVRFLEERFDEQAAAIDPERVLRLEYAQLCADPCGVIAEIAGLLNRQMPGRDEVGFRGVAPGPFRVSHGGVLDASQEQLLQAAVVRFYGGEGAGLLREAA